MASLYYFSAWTDSACLLGCFHEHSTVISAAACSPCAGSYVIAVENGVLRQLTDKEEADFQFAMYGAEAIKKARHAIVAMHPTKWLLN